MSDESVNHDEDERTPARWSTGKIARLSRAIRDELNRRLDDNQPASEILPWLNELPGVKEILAAQFSGAPVNEQNLSTWRYTGYRHWQQTQERFALILLRSEDAAAVSHAAQPQARGAAALAADRLFQLLSTDTDEKPSLPDLQKISSSAVALVKTEQHDARIQLAKDRLRLREEYLALRRDIHQRGAVSTMQRVLDDAQSKAIQSAPINNEAKIELLGRRHFGPKWRRRPVPTGQEPVKCA